MNKVNEYISNLSVKSKLFSVLFIPTLISVVSVIVILTSSYHDYQDRDFNNNQTEAFISVIDRSTQLIHNLQIERGITAGFFANQEINRPKLIAH